MDTIQFIATLLVLLFGGLVLFQLLSLIPSVLFGWLGESWSSFFSFFSVSLGGLLVCLPLADTRLHVPYGIPAWLMISVGVALVIAGWILAPKRAT